MHEKCSGAKGLLKKMERVFQCKVRGRVMEVVAESMNNGAGRDVGFVYLGDKLNAGGGCSYKFISTVT